MGTEARSEFLNHCLSIKNQLQQMVEFCVRGFLRAVDDDILGALLASAAKGEDADTTARLYSLGAHPQPCLAASRRAMQ